MKRYWRDHSYSITLLVIGTSITATCLPLREGTWFDLLSGIGTSFLTAGLLGLMAGPLRERNKPEEP